jgi:hypothetical protein
MFYRLQELYARIFHNSLTRMYWIVSVCECECEWGGGLPRCYIRLFYYFISYIMLFIFFLLPYFEHSKYILSVALFSLIAGFACLVYSSAQVCMSASRLK